MSYVFENYGFLQQGKMKNAPAFLLDLGVERRTDSSYFFDNAKRPGYAGYLLQYTLKGEGIFEQDGVQTIIKEGYAFLSKMPEQSKYYYHSSEWDFFYLHFDGPAILPFYESILDQCGNVFKIPVDHSTITLFFHLFHECTQSSSLPLYVGGEFIYRFLSQLLRYLEMPTGEDYPFLKKAQEYILENFALLSGIREVAAYCQVSHEHLSRSFQKETGQTIIAYLTRIRLEHSLSLLLNTSSSCDFIARACGFRSGNYFAKVFRKYLHCSPEEYRHRN